MLLVFWLTRFVILPAKLPAKIIQGVENIEPPFERSVLTVGNFDGVHLAHQRIIAQAGSFAMLTGDPVVVLTFEPHPLTVVAPSKAPRRLSLPDEKIRCLAESGADVIVVAHSEPELLGMDAEHFIRNILIDRFRPTHVIEGPSFGFGRGRRGTPELLSDVATPLGCSVHIVDPVTVQVDDGETLMVSSSLIRGLLADGRVRHATKCLGRPYALIGRVVCGDGRGRRIGIPTANIAVADQLVPGEGVYSGRAVVDRGAYACAISIGRTPTFGGSVQQVEAHLLGFDGDLYGQQIRVEFVQWLREQAKFATSQALVDQVRRDIETVRRNSKNLERVQGFP